MSMTQLLAFLVIVVLAAMSPGPDFFLVMRNAATSGWRAGVACSLGVGLGVFGWAVAIAVGIASVLTASAVAFTVVKVIGAVYLMFLGVKALLAARSGRYGAIDGGKPRVGGLGAAFGQGLLGNLLNPKCAFLYLAVMAQFLPQDASIGQTLLLATLAALGTVAWYVVLSVIVGSLRRLLTRARVRRALDALMGTVLVGLGVRVATQSS